MSSRIFRKRLTWYAKQVDLEDVGTIRRLLGEDWWFRLREPLLRVVLPEQCYQVWNRELGSYVWDEFGFQAYCEDLSRYPHVPTEYRKQRLSWFLFYMEVGKSWGWIPKGHVSSRGGSLIDLEWVVNVC